MSLDDVAAHLASPPPPGYRNGNGSRGAFLFWKETSIALAAVVFAVGGSWFAFGRDAVSAAEVRNLIALNSPYAIDKAQIQSELADDKQRIAELEQEHHEQLIADAAIREALARVEQKLGISP